MSPEELEFREALDFTLKWEGGFVDHESDPGGATAYGITQGTYDQFRKDTWKEQQSVIAITETERDTIYRDRYWKKAGCDEQAIFSPMIAMVQFDASVNVGVIRATKWLQSVVRSDRDGVYGPLTHQQFTEVLDEIGEDEMADQLIVKREGWYKYLRDKPDANFGVFFKGWMNRIDALRAELGVA